MSANPMFAVTLVVTIMATAIVLVFTIFVIGQITSGLVTPTNSTGISTTTSTTSKSVGSPAPVPDIQEYYAIVGAIVVIAAVILTYNFFFKVQRRGPAEITAPVVKKPPKMRMNSTSEVVLETVLDEITGRKTKKKKSS